MQIDPRGYSVCIYVWLAVSNECVSVRSGSVSFPLSQGKEGCQACAECIHLCRNISLNIQWKIMSCEVPPIATLLSSFFNIIPADSFVCLFLKIYCTECCGEGGGSPCAEMKRSVSDHFAKLTKYWSGTWEDFSVRIRLFGWVLRLFFFPLTLIDKYFTVSFV